MSWWIKCVHVNCSKPIKPRTPSVLLFSDAFGEEFGAHLASQDGSVLDLFKVTWSPLLRVVVISMLKEIMAVKFALFSFCPNASNSVIGVCCNNSSVVTYSNLVGGLGSEALECYH